MAEVKSTSCCGLAEIANISSHRNPKTTLLEVGQDRYDWGEAEANGAFYIFTDVGAARYGRRLANYIKEHELGKVTKTPGKRNPNTGNTLHLFTWALNGVEFKKWYRGIRKKKITTPTYNHYL